MLYKRLFLGCVAICTVVVCVIVRSLAPGWLLVLFGIVYLPLLGLHIFIHARFAPIVTLRISTIAAITASHFALVLAFLFQRDVTDTRYTVTPFTELLQLTPPLSQDGGPEMVFDAMLFLPACILWFSIWQMASTRSDAF